MWFSVVRKLFSPSGSYTVKTFLAHQLKMSFVDPCVLLPVNNVHSFSLPNHLKQMLARTLSTKSKLFENVDEEKQGVSKVKEISSSTKSASRRDEISHDVLQYFISNEMEMLLDRIPKEILKIKRKSQEVRYIFNKNVSDTIADNIKDHLLENDSPIFEANPGLGFLTNRLLDLPVSRIHLYEPSNAFRLQLNELVKANPGRVSMKDFNLFGVSKIVFQDKTDNGTRLHTLVQDLTRKEWAAAEPAMRIIGVLPSLTFAKHLMLSFIFQGGFMAYGRPELYLVMEPLLYTHLTCDGKSGFILYRTSSVLFQLIFEHQVLAKLPSKALFPWYVDKSLKKITKFNKVQKLDPEWVYLVKCVPRRDFYDTVVPQEQLQPLWFFIRQNMSSRHNRIIPQLERWIPGCGPRLIAKDMNIYSRFGDLSPRQILSTFRDFSSWPEYSACAFRASVEEAYLKMEPGSDDLDDVAAGRKDVDEAEDEDGADEMSVDTDHKPS